MNLSLSLKRSFAAHRYVIFYHAVLFALGVISLFLITPIPFAVYIYCIGLAIYVVLLVICRKIPKLSSLLDYLLINLLIFRASPDGFFLFPLLLLPSARALSAGQDFLGNALCFFLCIGSIMLLSHFELFEACVSYILLYGAIDIGFLWILYMYKRGDVSANKIQDEIIQFYSSQEKSYALYDSFLNILNSKDNSFKNIYCFSTHQFKIYRLVNASRLVSDYSISFDSRQIKELSRGTFVVDADVKICGKIIHAIAFLVKVEEINYIFVAEVSAAISVLDERFYQMEFFFSGVAKILYSEYQTTQSTHRQLQNLVQKMSYVRMAVNTMHYIRNRMTPIRLLIDVTADIPEKMREGGVEPMLKKLSRRANIEMDGILKRADYLLNKSNSPYEYSNQEIKAGALLDKVRSIWETYYLDSVVAATVDNENDLEEVILQSNLDVIEMLFSEIIGNIQKHSSDIHRCVFNLSPEKKVSIVFINDCKSGDRELSQLVTDYNERKREEIIKRSTHGVLNVLQLTEEANVTITASKTIEESRPLFLLSLSFN